MKLRVGLTGGIGSGKSSVARLLAGHGAVVIDYDQVARDVVAPGEPALAAIVERFGSEVLDASGALDRAAVAAVVFSDDASRRDLEAITHAAIFTRAFDIDGAAPDDSVVVHEIPLLIELGLHESFDTVIVVDASVDVRVARLVGQRGMDEADARARIATQLSSEQRRAVADYVIENDGDEHALAVAVDAVWRDLTS